MKKIKFKFVCFLLSLLGLFSILLINGCYNIETVEITPSSISESDAESEYKHIHPKLLITGEAQAGTAATLYRRNLLVFRKPKAFEFIGNPVNTSYKLDLSEITTSEYVESSISQRFITMFLRKAPEYVGADYDLYGGVTKDLVVWGSNGQTTAFNIVGTFEITEPMSAGDYDIDLTVSMILSGSTFESDLPTNSITAINTTTDTVEGRELAAPGPIRGVVDPTLNKVYTLDYLNTDNDYYPGNSVTVINRTLSGWPELSYSKTLAIPVERDSLKQQLSGIAINRNNSRVYVTTDLQNDKDGYLYIYDGGNSWARSFWIPDTFIELGDDAKKIGRMIVDENENKVYIANPENKSVIIVDDSGAIPSTFEAIINVNFKPLIQYLDSDNGLLFIAGDNVLEIYDTSLATSSVISIGKEPTMMVCSPESNLIFISCEDSNRVYAVDYSSFVTPEVDNVIVGSKPARMALDPEDKVLYVVNNESNNVSIIDVIPDGTFLDVINTVSVPVGPMSVVVQNGKAYVAATGDVVNHLSDQIDYATTYIEVISNPRGSPPTVSTIEAVGLGPTFITSDPDNNRIYVHCMVLELYGGFKSQPGIFSVSSGAPARLKKGTIVRAYPSVFKPATGVGDERTLRIAYDLTAHASVTLYLYDVGGKIIWTYKAAAGAEGGRAGYNEVDWNGITDLGGYIGNGIYVLKIVSGDKVLGTGKIVVYE